MLWTLFVILLVLWLLGSGVQLHAGRIHSHSACAGCSCTDLPAHFRPENSSLERFQNWCRPASPGRAALRLDYSCGLHALKGRGFKRLLKKPVSAGVLKRSAFRCAVKLFVLVITSGRTGVPNERRFCACWGKVQPARDLLFRLFQRPCSDGRIPPGCISRSRF